MMLRQALRNRFLQFFRKALVSDEGRAAAADSLSGLLAPVPRNRLDLARLADLPYPDLGEADPRHPSGAVSPIFITGRFRSGTTLLWNVFRDLEGCTAYYEPLNERRYFDPVVRGNRVDATHLGVTDYWQEYEGLESLRALYDEDWIRRDLYLDADAWKPRLKAYVDRLIEHAPARAVLQFNRIDFRLPWFRRNYPSAKIVHIYRHPRDQWCSTFLKKEPFPPHGAMRDYAAHDEFYLRVWTTDLRFVFPFLDQREVSHPYQLSYYLWRLSYLFGRQFADHSLSLEDLLADPFDVLSRLFAYLEPGVDIAALCRLVRPVRTGKWREYADQQWFSRHESHCENVLQEYFRQPFTVAERHARQVNGTSVEVPVV